MSKIPGGKPPEKTEPLLPAEAGIGSNNPDPQRPQINPSSGGKQTQSGEVSAAPRRVRVPEELSEDSIGAIKRPPGWLKGI